MKNRRARIRLGFLIVLVLAWPVRVHSQTPSPPPNEKKAISITWLDHAAFEIVSPGGVDLLIDSFLTNNPATPPECEDLARYHSDSHPGDAVELAN